MLTFPMSFDLEKLVMAAYHGKATPTECLEEGEGRDVGNCSLRRKLFGQPERQVCVCVCVCGCGGGQINVQSECSSSIRSARSNHLV